MSDNKPSVGLLVTITLEEEDDDPGDGAEDDGGEDGQQEVSRVGGGVQVGDGEAGVGPGVEAVDETPVDATGVIPGQSIPIMIHDIDFADLYTHLCKQRFYFANFGSKNRMGFIFTS